MKKFQEVNQEVNQMIVRLMNAEIHIRDSGQDFNKFISQSAYHNEYAQAFQALREYAESLKPNKLK